MTDTNFMVYGELLGIGLRLTGLALIGFTVFSFVTGSATATGATIRASLTPTLRGVRDTSELSRAQLADRSILAAAAVCALSVFIDRSFVAAIVTGLILVSRPSVVRMAREERPLFALAQQQFSGDLLIGLYAPMALAQMMFNNYLMSAAFSLVLLSLSWPPGGAGRAWKPAWVIS